LAKCSACCRSKRSAPRRCSPAPWPAWRTTLILPCRARPKPAAPRGTTSLPAAGCPHPSV
jgi:hypothetical protein